MDAGRNGNTGRGRLLLVAITLVLIGLPTCLWAKIPAGPDVATNRDHVAQVGKFLERMLLEPYLANREKAGSTLVGEDPAEQFLRLWITTASTYFEQPDINALVENGKRAHEAGCKDAAFAYCYGRVLAYRGDSEASTTHLKYALENLEASGYDVLLCSWAAMHLEHMLRNLERFEEAKPVAERQLECLLKAVSDGTYHPNEQSVFYRNLALSLEGRPIPTVARIAEGLNAQGQLYPWLMHMVSARLEVRRAWEARGGGWATEVTEEGWKGFEEHMKAAHDHLAEAWSLNPEWPESAAEMISVAMAGHAPAEETTRFWFDRAVSAQLDYKPAYTSYMWSIMPRWGGSHQQLYQFGRECLETKRFDTHVPYFFLYAFELIVSDIGSNYEYYKIPGVYEELQAMADGYLAEPSMQQIHPWYRTLKAAAAARCERWDDAQRFLLALDHEPNSNAFTRFGLEPEETIAQIHARSGDLGKEHAEADELAKAGKYDEARAKYDQLAAKTSGQQHVTTYFRGRVLDAEFDRDFTAGKWTKLPIDASLSGWRNRGGKWSVDDEGRLVGEAQTNGLTLVYEKKLGTNFELRGDVTFVSKQQPQCNAGVYFGQETGRLTNSFRIFGADDYAAVMKNDEPLASKPATIEDATKFLVRRRDNAITAYVNDELVASDVEIEPYGPPSNEVIALGGRYWYQGPVLRFENLEIRTLDSDSSAKDTETDAAEEGEPAEVAEEDEGL